MVMRDEPEKKKSTLNGKYLRISAYLIDKRRQDNHPNISPKLRLELQTTLAIKEQIPCRSRPIFSEPLVQLVTSHGFEPIPGCVKEVVEIRLVVIVIKFITGFFEFGALDKTRLQEDL